MRLVIAIGAALLLGGCNLVTSETPWFAPADAAGAPALRHGVWLGSTPDKPCAVDERQPLDRWPDCAGGLVVHDGELLGKSGPDGDKVWTPTPYVLAKGDPRILQALFTIPAIDQGAKAKPLYFYFAVVPTKVDDQGQVVAFRGWNIVCGPPPAASDDTSNGVTRKPFPGIVVSDSDCKALSVAALQRAAKLSEALDTDGPQAHWVRDGEK